MPPSFDRHIVADGTDLLAFASPLDWDRDGPRPITGARYDAAATTWSMLPATTTSGYQAWAVDDWVVINPHFCNATGGVFDTAAKQWASLPSEPRGGTWTNDLAGVVGSTGATFASPVGWVLDITDAQWIEIQRLDDRVDFPQSPSFTAVDRDLFLFGGERWTNEGAGGLLKDAWIWRGPG